MEEYGAVDAKPKQDDGAAHLSMTRSRGMVGCLGL